MLVYQYIDSGYGLILIADQIASRIDQAKAALSPFHIVILLTLGDAEV